MIISGNDAELEYSIIMNQNVKVTGTGCIFRNCTIYNGTLDVDESIELYNTIVYNPKGEALNIANAKTVTAKNNCFSGTTTGPGAYTDLAAATKWNTDPKFVDAVNEDFKLKTTSPCRNAGDNSVWYGTMSIVDYDDNEITNSAGKIVANNGWVDIGALECQFEDVRLSNVFR